MRTSMSLLCAGVLALGACTDVTTPVSLRAVRGSPAHSIADDPGVSFSVTGFTYGPGQTLTEITNPPCAQVFTDSVSQYVWWAGYYTEDGNWDSTRVVFATHYRKGDCDLGAGNVGAAFEGGSISITGTSPQGGLGLGSTPARFDRVKTIDNFPASATVVFTAYPYPNSTCPNPTFERWIMDGNYSNYIYGNPLSMPATDAAYHRISGEFICHTSPPPPPPPPGDGGGGDPVCEDPAYCFVTLRAPTKPSIPRKTATAGQLFPQKF